MKIWKKLLSLLMVLTMVFTMAACGKNDADVDKEKEKTPEELLCGEWVMECDLSGFINNMLTTLINDFPESKTKLPYTISFTFDGKGGFVMKLNLKEADFDTYLDDLCAIMVDYMLDLAQEADMTEEDFRAQCEQEYGMTLEEYASSTMEEATANAVQGFNQTSSGYYKLVNSKVYMDEDQEDLEDVTNAEESMTVTITETTLKITELGGKDSDFAADVFELIGLDLPWELQRK